MTQIFSKMDEKVVEDNFWKVFFAFKKIVMKMHPYQLRKARDIILGRILLRKNQEYIEFRKRGIQIFR
jgi:hypothetical protein